LSQEVIMNTKRFKNPDDYKNGDIIISDEEISDRLEEIVEQLARKFGNKKLLVIGLLTGGAWITVDIVERLHRAGLTHVELTFIKVSSYQKGTTATQEPQIELDTSIDTRGREILLIDDIADTGKTLVAVTKLLQSKKAHTITSFVLLDKPSRREVVYKPDYCGFEIPDIWVQGRGLDSNGYGRGDPHIRKGPYHY
jgi:hypoxanthine phosphoribosyltransferase